MTVDFAQINEAMERTRLEVRRIVMAEGAAAERTKIVAWLRKEANQTFDQSVFATDSDRHLAEICFKMVVLAADAIERGEHASGEEEPT